MNVHLQRLYLTSQATIGVLCHAGVPVCYTLELPWRQNALKISCIPAGVYPCNAEKWSFRLPYVKDRNGILIHAGNTVNDSRGCILVGKSFKRDGTLLESKYALELCLEVLPQSFILEVRNP